MKKVLGIVFLGFLWSGSAIADVVPCNEPKCNKKFDLTLTRFVEAKEKNNKPILVWLSGGTGQYFSTDPLSEVEGRYDMVVMFNPYNISTGSQKRSDGYAPMAYKPDQADRIKSIIKFYKEKYKKPIWLGGNSFGAARTLAYLSASPNNSKLISGVILAAPGIGSVKNNTIKVPFRKITDLNLPIGIFHHIRDVCDHSHYKTAKRLNKRLEKINLGKTQFISIESGNFPKDKNCKGGKGKNHNFQDSKKDLGEKVINFIETNS
jgi:pimeloyl-ACP methyl ester carboxylesterase